MARGDINVTVKGRLFGRGMVDEVIDQLNETVEQGAEDIKIGVIKRLRRGRGRRTGALAESFGDSRVSEDLTANVSSIGDAEVEDYYHRVEYGAAHMVGQNQRKNARRRVKRQLEKGLTANELVEFLNG